MTLIAAWIRKTPGNRELIVASDSRVTGGIGMDYAPKIFRLERNDAVLAYCGTTAIAYPILLQIKAGIDAYEETRNRVIDLIHIKSHIEKVIENLRAAIRDPSTTSVFKFLLAGYSWKVNDFRVWTFKFDIKTGEFNAYKMMGNHNFLFMSDADENESRARALVMRRISSSRAAGRFGLDWQPLSALIDQINDEDVWDIGGPPQILKIYRHSNVMPVNVLWPEKRTNETGISETVFRVTHLGRALLAYERSRFLTLDCQTMELVEPWNIRDRIERYNLVEQQRERIRLLGCLRDQISWLGQRKSKQESLQKHVDRGASFQDLKQLGLIT